MIDDYLSYLKAVRGLSALTCLAYRRDLELWKDHLDSLGIPWDKASSLEASSFLNRLGKEGLAPSSVNRILSCLRGYYRHFIRKGALTVHPFTGIRGLKQKRTLPGFLFEKEMAELLKASRKHRPGKAFQSCRDQFLLELLYSTGCRVAEVCSLKLGDFQKDFTRLKVTGKGNRQRVVFLTDQAKEALWAYLAQRSLRVDPGCAQAQDHLFLNRLGQPLGIHGVAKILARYVGEAALTKKVSPHTFRHTFATHLMNEGLDVRVVQELLGHSRLETTQVYTHLSLDRLKDVVRSAHPHG